MNVTPIVPLRPLESIEQLVKINGVSPDKINKTDENPGYSFADLLNGMINGVNQTDAQAKTDAVNLALGFADMQDLHNIEINAIKADLALRTMVSVRNKVLDAYAEIMRITI